MARQSRAQKKTIERVMHEYTEGDLESSSGRKVKKRKQAVAIALSEAGASRKETPAQNRRNLQRTKARERKGETGRRSEGPTREELYAEAKRRNIAGRSKMNKDQLKRALGR